MSKLINHIEAHQTHRRFAKPSGPVSYSDLTSIETNVMQVVPHLIEYRIDVRLGATVRIERDEDIPNHVRRMARMLEQEVFGEFSEDIDNMYRALWNYDCDKAKEILDAMRERMFSS